MGAPYPCHPLSTLKHSSHIATIPLFCPALLLVIAIIVTLFTPKFDILRIKW